MISGFTSRAESMLVSNMRVFLSAGITPGSSNSYLDAVFFFLTSSLCVIDIADLRKTGIGGSPYDKSRSRNRWMRNLPEELSELLSP